MVPKRVERALRRGGVRGGMVMRLFALFFSCMWDSERLIIGGAEVDRYIDR